MMAGGCYLAREADGVRLSALRGAGEPRFFASARARRCGGGGVRQDGGFRPDPRSLEMCDETGESPARLGRVGDDGARGRRFPSWRRRQVVSASSLLAWSWWSSGESLDPVGSARWRRSRRRSSVGGIVFEDTAKDPNLRSSGDRRCPRLTSYGAMYVAAGVAGVGRDAV
jgi:hypothetical protein